MIWGDDFIWLHFPKCAGSKVERLFQQYFRDDSSIHQDPIDHVAYPDAPWHHSIADRSAADPTFESDGKVVICPFRRLPSWLISRYNFEVQRSPALEHRPGRLLKGRFLESNGYENHADWYLQQYLPDEVLAKHEVRFVRTEHFADDFRTAFAPFLDVGRIPYDQLETRVNSSKDALGWSNRLRLHLANRRLYRACPRWAKTERLAYG